VNVHFNEVAREDYQHWLRHDDATLRKVNDLIEDARRRPFVGLGKPEPLKGDPAGWWSRRIMGDHRLVYRVAGKRGADQRIEVASCRFHYGRG
jgi:toxin YoeB